MESVGGKNPKSKDKLQPNPVTWCWAPTIKPQAFCHQNILNSFNSNVSSLEMLSLYANAIYLFLKRKRKLTYFHDYRNIIRINQRANDYNLILLHYFYFGFKGRRHAC